jgi:peptidase M1-like protein
MLVAIRRALLVSCAVALVTCALPAFAADAALSQADREGIEAALKQKSAGLLALKDKNGVSYKRGSYSRTFKSIDATTAQVGYHVDTVEPSTQDPNSDQLKTERLVLTLKKGSGAWSIAKEEVAETVTRLYRGWFGGNEVYAFDSFKFEREGLKLSASKGLAYTRMRNGKVEGFTLAADDLKYEYSPPADTGYYGLVAKRILKDHPEDIVFKPASVAIRCDAESCQSVFKPAFEGFAKVAAAPGAAASGTGGAGRFAKVFDADVRDFEKNRKDYPFSNFWLTPEPDRRFWIIDVTRDSSQEHIATLAYDNWQPWEMGYFVTRYGRFEIGTPYGPLRGIPLFAYYSEDTRKSGVPPYSLETRDDIDGRDYEINTVKGDVGLAIEDPVTLTGDVTFQLTVKRELASIPFAISRQNVETDVKDAKNPRLFVNSIQDGAGNELTWVKRGPFDGLLLLPEPVESGTKMTLRMQFTSLDAIRKINPTYSSLDRGGWLPFVRFADFIQSFDMTVRTPEKYTVLGIGKKLEDTVVNGIRTTRWTSESPVSFSTVIFGDYISGNTGKYKATKKDGTEIPVNVYVDKTSTAALDTQFSSAADVQEFNEAAATGARDIRGKQLGPIATQAAVALNLYKEIYDIDYPFAKLDLVADPEGTFYGQAPSSIIYLGFGVFRGEGEVAAGGLFAGGSRITKFNKDVVAHETGHQWWGSVIVNSNQRNYWFVETLAELSSAVYVERVHGKKKYLEKIDEWRRTVMDNEQVTSVQNNYTVWAGEDGFGSVQSNIYNKGPYAFHIFRSTFGDEKFYALLKEMAKELQHKEIVTRDIQDVMEKVVGGNMDWFFDQWIRGIGKPQYAIFWTKRKNEQGKWLVEGTIKQRVVYGKYKETMPGVFYRGVAPLTFIDANGKEVKEAKPRLVQGAETPFKVIVADEPEQVLFNKDGEILAEDLLVNRSW